MTLALIPIVLGLVVNLATSTFEVKAAWWPPLVWTIVVLLTAVSVLSQVTAARSTPPDRQVVLDNVVADLRATIKRQWHDEAVRVLGLERDPMPVRWNLVAQPGFTANPDDMASTAGLNQIGITGETVWSGSGDRIGDVVARFRALDRPRLVVLGGPGAGKTTLAIQLLRELLNGPQADEPVPVLLTLTGWDRAEHPHFGDWLAARLEQRYSSLPAAGPGTALALFRTGRIMPILDGLDEVHAELLPDVLNAINDALEASTRIVVTCRTPEYLQAIAVGQSIADAALLSAQPLSAAVTADYLERILARTIRHPGWNQVLDHLRGETPSALTEVVASPLGLWLTSTTYVTPGTDPGPLLGFAAPAALRSHLLDRLVPALIAARSPAQPDDTDLFRPRRVYEASDVTRWLAFLARILAREPSTERGIGRASVGKRDLAWWELAAAVTTGYPPGWRVTVAMTIASITWGLVIGGLVLGFGPWTALVGGIGLFLGYREGPGHRDHGTWLSHSPARADLRLGGGRTGLLLRKVLLDLAIWVVVLAVVGAVSGVVGYFSNEGALSHVLGAVLLLGPALVLVAMVNAVVAWAESPVAAAGASTPLTTWRADKTLNLFRIVLGGALGAICGGSMLSLADQPVAVVVVGTALTTGAGLVYGVVSGRHHAWLVFATAQR
ncbi:NACHT domain-containing protein [Nonomuraea sp. NPDC050153]|uniref:NACHT domain-containing protein n=1 Tax=Nonomuraea sp. NPDC050153 TaxID=3364359 RepID=UPI00379E6D0A